jgi:nucleoside-diphosphate-sugar epimerase
MPGALALPQPRSFERMVNAVTGANGYVGGVIAQALGPETIRLVRRPAGPQDVAWAFGDDPAADLRARGVTRVVHAAWDMKASRLQDLEAGCVAGSRLLLEAAKAAGASFTFISTISAFEGARSAYGQAKLQVERMVLAAGGNVLRAGLVYGEGDGGMFGSLRDTVTKARFIPLIGDGSAPQYLLPETILAQAVQAEFVGLVTVADSKPIAFRDLLRQLATAQGKSPVLIPVPWQILYAGFRCAEATGLKLGFKSDSVLSLVFQNPAPDFGPMRQLGIGA